MIEQAPSDGRRRVIRNGVVMGAATGAYGLTFGALGVASGLSLLQTCILSLAMFTGGSQFAFVGVVGGGGSPLAGAATALLLGARNTLYGLTVAPMLRVHGPRKVAAAQLVIDESAAMSVGETKPHLKRLAFWATGLGVFGFWNAATVIGAIAAESLPDPQTLGLDAVAPAAFIFLFAPRLRSRQAWVAAAIGACVALVVVPFVPAGLPVIVAALAIGGYALVIRSAGAAADPDPMPPDADDAPTHAGSSTAEGPRGAETDRGSFSEGSAARADDGERSHRGRGQDR